MAVHHYAREVLSVVGASEFRYPALIFILFVFPRFLVRYGIPLAISAFALGVVSNHVFDAFIRDGTVKLLSSFGIIALFLFAGLEVDIREIRDHLRVLLEHIVIRIIALLITTAFIASIFGLNIRAASLLALALVTPSTGFILESLETSKLAQKQKFWIKTKAISVELIALFVMFVSVKSGTLTELTSSIGIMVGLVLILPLVFKFFAERIAPYAPKSEFGFLVIVATLAGMLTKKLGAYYLIGAFLVGVAARRFEESVPALSSKNTLRSIKVFASFFTPFYFFSAGLGMSKRELSLEALLLGLAAVLIIAPLRVFLVMLHRKLSLRESFTTSFPIAVSLLPNLVFGLVLAQILQDVFHIRNEIFGGLIFYTVVVTLIPPIALKLMPAKANQPRITPQEIEIIV
ncbi:MAG: cation:proton antiporter [Bacteriovoracia bacterium]